MTNHRITPPPTGSVAWLRWFRSQRPWRNLATQVIREEPMCWLRLPGCTHRSTTADHIIPASQRPELAHLRSNVRGACRNCNSRRSDKHPYHPDIHSPRRRPPRPDPTPIAIAHHRRRPSPALQFFTTPNNGQFAANNGNHPTKQWQPTMATTSKNGTVSPRINGHRPQKNSSAC